MSVAVHGRERTPTPAASSPAQEPGGPIRFVHSPEHLARLIVFAVAFVAVAVIGWVLDRAVAGLHEDISVLAVALPGAAGPLIVAAVTTLSVLIVVLGLVGARSWGGLRATVTAASAAAGAFLAVLGALLLAVERDWLGDAGGPPLVLAFAGAGVAVLVIVREGLPARLVRAGWWLLVPATIVSTLGTQAPIGAEVLALLGAAVVGAAVAVGAGTPSRALTGDAVRTGLERVGLPVESVAPVSVDARASVPWLARLATGRELFVKTRSSEERSADLLFRIWRLIRLRRTGDGLPEASLRRAVEHEAFVASRAAAVGVRAPRLLAIGRAEGGVLAAYEKVDGTTFAELGEAVGPAALREAWSMSQVMHRAGMAHRDLRAANLLVDGDGHVWIVDFGFAEVAASEAQILHDVVELVASTAATVGIGPAVDAAVEVLGPHTLAEALPYVQPAATSAATRRALGRDGFEQLHRALVEATGAPEPSPPRLERVRLRTVLSIVALGVALWVLLPQIARQGDLWRAVTGAHPGWAAAVLLAAAGSYAAATVGLLGAVPSRVPVLPAFAAQVASSFTNRVTPANVGGLALNTRFLARTGAGTAGAATAVGLSATAGAVMHVVLTVFALAWAGSAGLGDVTLPEPRTLALTGGCVAALVAVGLAVPKARRFLVDRLSGALARSLRSAREVARSPRQLLMLFGGSALVTVANAAALALSLRAFGATVALSTVAVVYLAGSAVGTAAPTPGGLGAVEAALVAGLVATSVGQGEALAAVLLFRLATFWLPILPGWLSFVVLQRRGYI